MRSRAVRSVVVVMLMAIKAVHSAIFLVMLSAIGWLLATGLTGRRDRSVAAAGALVAAESVVFLANGGRCPLTPLAEHYGARRGGVSDIFLPDVVAQTIPIWASSAVVVAAALHLHRWCERLDRRQSTADSYESSTRQGPA